MVSLARRIAGDGRFSGFIIGVIVVNAVLVGLETSGNLLAWAGVVLELFNYAVVAIFMFEIGVRIIAYWPRPLAFFRDGWNVFDFVVVAITILPAVGTFAAVVRLARVLRILRLVSVHPELRLIVGTMLRSLRSMFSILLLLGLVVYVYAVLGYHLFGAIDPDRWGDLGKSVKTLFETLTLEGWLEYQAAVIAEVPFAWLYFGSYIVIAVFIVVNLFIAVVLHNLQTVKSEQEEAAVPVPLTDDADLLRRVQSIRAELSELESRLGVRTGGARLGAD